MFDPSKYSMPKIRRLPVILLLDVSGSMYGQKIEKLYDAVNEMIEAFVAQAVKETEINVAIFTFGANVGLHTPYTPVADLKEKGISRFTANGGTPLGLVLQMAKDYIEDREVTFGSDYSPAVVVVSDGWPNDSWEGPMQDFISNGRSSKSQRLAVAIGSDADIGMLTKFTGDSSMVFVTDVGKIADSFRKVTMSVSARAKTVGGGSRAGSAAAGNDAVKSRTVSRKKVKIDDDDDDGEDLEI